MLPAIDTYRKELDFAEVVPVSARCGTNTDTLISCIFKYLPYGQPFYDEDTVTDQPERQIVAELIREKGPPVPERRNSPMALQWPLRA